MPTSWLAGPIMAARAPGGSQGRENQLRGVVAKLLRGGRFLALAQGAGIPRGAS